MCLGSYRRPKPHTAVHNTQEFYKVMTAAAFLCFVMMIKRLMAKFSVHVIKSQQSDIRCSCSTFCWSTTVFFSWNLRGHHSHSVNDCPCSDDWKGCCLSRLTVAQTQVVSEWEIIKLFHVNGASLSLSFVIKCEPPTSDQLQATSEVLKYL